MSSPGNLFATVDLEALSGPHVGRSWFVAMDLPGGIVRMHNGVGRVTLGGYEWRGVSDPIGGRLVSVNEIEDSQFGQANAVTISLAGVDVDFLRSVQQEARNIEGGAADIYFATFDPETAEVIIGLKRLFPGVMSAPRISRQGLGVRAISITVESIWSSHNFQIGGKWNSSHQKRRFPGDLGLDFIGVKISDNWR